MTLALSRTVKHYDVLDMSGLLCLICTEDGKCVATDVVLVAGELRRVRLCHACGERYTTRCAPIACPDGFAWCVNHEVDVDGYHWHRSPTSIVHADRDGRIPQREVDTLDVHAVLVNNDDGTPDPVIWLTERYLTPDVCLAEGMGISPGRAREIAVLLVRLADDLDGSVSR